VAERIAFPVKAELVVTEKASARTQADILKHAAKLRTFPAVPISDNE